MQHSSAGKLRTESHKIRSYPSVIEMLRAIPGGTCHEPHFMQKRKLRLRRVP